MTRWRVLLAAGWLLPSWAVTAARPVSAEPPASAQVSPADPSRIVGPPRGRPMTGGTLDARTEEVAALLRCPVCQGLSVADSPATMAVDMKLQVKDMLAAGFDEEQILSYFERSYGEFVRLRPPLRGVNWLVWLAPVLGLVAGAVAIIRALRSSARSSAAAETSVSEVPGRDTLPADPELARYVLRVRALAYGWPEGRSPAVAVPPPSPAQRS